MTWIDRGQESLTLKLVDKAVRSEGAQAAQRVSDLRSQHPTATTAELVGILNSRYQRLSVAAGAGVGATAAMPVVGTVTSLGLSAVEAAAFLNVSARYVLCRAILQDSDPEDFTARRAMVMAIMLGKAGVNAAERSVGEMSARQWARTLAARQAARKAGGMQGTLVRTFVTRYVVRKGATMLGRAVPFGVGALIGGISSRSMSAMVIEGADEAFGSPGASAIPAVRA